MLALGLFVLAALPVDGGSLFSSVLDEFVALFPVPPHVETGGVEIAGVRKASIRTYRVDEPNTQWLISATDIVHLDLDLQRTLSGARDGVVEKGGGSLVSERPIRIAGYEGFELRLERPDKSVIRTRICVTPRRIYQVIVMTAEERETPATDRKVPGIVRSGVDGPRSLIPVLADNTDVADEPTSPGKAEPMRRPVRTVVAGALALAAGSAIAWVDSRPNWDDTGVTAGVLLLAAGLVAVLGLRWWVAALLVASPIVLLEHRSAGWGILVTLGFTAAGSAVGAALRGLGQDSRTE